jgi:PadR family transcriptional regulator PadR
MQRNMLRESVELLTLQALTPAPKSRLAILAWIRTATRTTLTIDEGSLYPVIHRLTRRRFVRARTAPSADGTGERLYELTPAGRNRLASQSRAWQRHIDAIAQALTPHASKTA